MIVMSITNFTFLPQNIWFLAKCPSLTFSNHNHRLHHNVCCVHWRFDFWSQNVCFTQLWSFFGHLQFLQKSCLVHLQSQLVFQQSGWGSPKESSELVLQQSGESRAAFTHTPLLSLWLWLFHRKAASSPYFNNLAVSEKSCKFPLFRQLPPTLWLRLRQV